MVNLKKVVKIGSTKTTNPNKKDQEKYEEKVKKMRAACENFEEKFNESLDFPQVWQGLLKENFKGQMAKNRLVSRTSRILHDMSKKLSKFKHGFDPNKVEDYIKAFNFKAKKANSKDYIKRSAIDDKEVADFFNSDIPNILREKVEREAAFEKILDEAEGIQEQSRKSLDMTNGLVGKLEETISDVKDNAEAKKELGEAKKQLRKSIKELENQIENTEKAVANLENIQDNPKASEEKKQQAAKNVKRESKKLDDAVGELGDNIQKANEVHTEVQEKIEAAEMSPFDEKTKTFTVKTENDFRKVEGYENKIENVVIKENVKTIKNWAFGDCKALQNIDFKNVTTVGMYAFEGCTKLQSIDFENVTTVGELAFNGCTALQSIDFKNVKTIKDWAFGDCKTLQSIDLKNVTTVGESAFRGCKALQNIDFENVTTVGMYAFEGCTKLQSIDFKNVKTVGLAAFSDCTALQSIDLGGVTDIKEYMFSGCKSLEKIDLGRVTNIGKGAFYNCNSLKEVDLKNVTTVKGLTFEGCKNLEKVTLPKNEKAAKIKENILKQTGKNAGDGKNGTIQFINDPEPAKQKK